MLSGMRDIRDRYGTDSPEGPDTIRRNEQSSALTHREPNKNYKKRSHLASRSAISRKGPYHSAIRTGS